MLQDTTDLFSPLNLSALLVVLVLLLLLINSRKRQPKHIVAYRTDNGNVTISRSAVVELVRTSCEQLDQVSKPSLRVYTKKGLTHFTIRIQLSSGSSLKDVEKTLQSHLRESLSQDLGIENLGEINIVVTSFKSKNVRVSSGIPSIYTTPTAPVKSTADVSEVDSDDSKES